MQADAGAQSPYLIHSNTPSRKVAMVIKGWRSLGPEIGMPCHSSNKAKLQPVTYHEGTVRGVDG